jgi:hypothetical protein
MKGRVIGFPEGFGHWRDTIKFLKSFLLRSTVGLQIHNCGFMMSRSKHEHVIGSPHRRQGTSHPADFDMHSMG